MKNLDNIMASVHYRKYLLDTLRHFHSDNYSVHQIDNTFNELWKMYTERYGSCMDYLDKQGVEGFKTMFEIKAKFSYEKADRMLSEVVLK